MLMLLDVYVVEMEENEEGNEEGGGRGRGERGCVYVHGEVEDRNKGSGRCGDEKDLTML